MKCFSHVASQKNYQQILKRFEFFKAKIERIEI